MYGMLFGKSPSLPLKKYSKCYQQFYLYLSKKTLLGSTCIYPVKYNQAKQNKWILKVILTPKSSMVALGTCLCVDH